MGESELRGLLSSPTLARDQRLAAIAVMRRRFRSDAALASAANAEAALHVEALDEATAYQLFGEVRRRYAVSTDPEVRREVVHAISGQILSLEAIQARAPLPTDNGLAEWPADDRPDRIRQELVAQYGDDPDPEIRHVVAIERFNLALGADARDERFDPSAFHAIVADYEGDPGLEYLLADIFVHLGVTAPDPGRAIASFREAIRRFGGSDQPGVRSHVGNAYAWTLYLLTELGRSDEAARIRAEYEAWSEDSPAPQPDRQ